MIFYCAPGHAQGLVIPGIGPSDEPGRRGYREAAFPPPQHDDFGQPLAPPLPDARPTYRETYSDYPPPGGRYGGGVVEYVMTGGRPEPVDPQVVPYPNRIRVASPVNAAAPLGYDAAVPYRPSSPGLISAMTAAVPGDVGSLPDERRLAPAALAPDRGALPMGGLPDYDAALAGAGATPRRDVPAAYAPDPYASARYAPDPYAQGDAGQGYEPRGYGGRSGYGQPEGAPVALEREPDPAFARQVVAYSGQERPGTVIIDTPSKYLYLVQPGGQAIRYGIGVGRPGFMWSGVKRVSRKAEWPGWTPPSQMIARRPDLPRHMEGGLGNPLGARALYLGSSLYRIHGTNEPWTIGRNVSSGCIRMMNADVEDLYDRVGVGAKVVVL